MKRVGPGQFQVSPGEQIRVKIEKSVGQWLASVSDLDGADWNPEPDQNTAGEFQSPSDGESASFSALYNFTPGGSSSGDFYTITIEGQSGGPSTSFVDAPALQDRTYTFRVQS